MPYKWEINYRVKFRIFCVIFFFLGGGGGGLYQSHDNQPSCKHFQLTANLNHFSVNTPAKVNHNII